VNVVKYFYEEPAYLEDLSPQEEPDARRRLEPVGRLEDLLSAEPFYRGYLAGTDLSRDRTGLTAVASPEAFTEPLLAVFAGLAWMLARPGAAVAAITAVQAAEVLRDPGDALALVGAPAPVPPEYVLAAASAERRYALTELKRLLAAAAVVLFPEPAHHGHDWSLFSRQPLADDLRQSFRAHPAPGTRRFLLPYRRARSEHTFYFERWALDDLPEFVEEVGE
jgi:hypothetical protein